MNHNCEKRKVYKHTSTIDLQLKYKENKTMKLLTFKQNNKQKLGIHTDQGIIDVEATIKETNQTHIRTDIMDIIASTPADMKLMADFINQALNDHTAIFVSEDQIIWEPSVTRPGKIICVGLNYAKHADETGSPYPKS